MPLLVIDSGACKVLQKQVHVAHYGNNLLWWQLGCGEGIAVGGGDEGAVQLSLQGAWGAWRQVIEGSEVPKQPTGTQQNKLDSPHASTEVMLEDETYPGDTFVLRYLSDRICDESGRDTTKVVSLQVLRQQSLLFGIDTQHIGTR